MSTAKIDPPQTDTSRADLVFDAVADDYDAALAQGIAVSGEDKNFFARGRVEWLGRCLSDRTAPLGTVIDYGCGTGSGAPFLQEILRPEHVLGIDVSHKSLAVARADYGGSGTSFAHCDEYVPSGAADIVYCNGTLHHVPVAERAGVIAYIYRCLKPGGIFALWENNPWNPGTQYVMLRCPFDKGVVKVTPPAARRLVTDQGFEIVRQDFYFIFPRFLAALRPWEPSLTKTPLGTQYQLLCRKPLQ
ncbi:SAM-dependent methyltransferase [Capsulimonas corticalis]|uniref:SAM-dependent methyltransferase n=1 Tax=Capsulimonas corticalis TaxID=2219043 RepID=A0A402D3Y2_9BACT|nr:class I SAM-dependent methyltransferase [Capsulimonas corticalis]BDI29694.1 SAM-dependent methyltransferase [Capsulimonas corticalis]